MVEMDPEKTKRRIAQALIDQSLNGQDVLTCKQVLQEDLPAFVRDAILAKARKHLREQKPLTWNFKANVDLDDPEVKESFEKLVFSRVKSVRFSRKEIESIFF